MEHITTKNSVKEAIKESGMKQYELAEKLCITQASVSNSINRQRIGADVLVSFMDAMGFTVVIGKKEKGKFLPLWELQNEKQID